jgi:hypothetical protein
VAGLNIHQLLLLINNNSNLPLNKIPAPEILVPVAPIDLGFPVKRLINLLVIALM